MKQTAMQDLKEDLILTKSSIKDALLEIKNEEINKACIEVVNLTLNRIIKRIDDELLEMEKEQMIEARATAPLLASIDKDDYIKEAEQYYNETYEKR
jgi:hypothetical protein